MRMVLPAPLATVTVIAGEIVLLPAASRARAVSVCEPFPTVVVSHAVEYGALVSSAPCGTPSTKNWTPATPALSEASASTGIVADTVAPAVGAVIVTDGEELSTVTTTAVEVVLLPAASRATAVTVCDPLLAVTVSHEIE